MTTTKALLEALRRCATRDCFTECCYFDDKDCWPHILQDAAKHILLLTLENSNLREENQVLRGLGHSYGIGKFEDADLSFDVYQVIRTKFGDPRGIFSYHQLPEFRKIERDDTKAEVKEP